MTTELSYLLLSTALLVGVHLLEVMHNLIGQGILPALHGYKPSEKPAWRTRLAAVETNLAHNLVIFAVLVFAAHVLKVNGAGTALGASIFFFARVVHALAYAAAVPFVRAVAYMASLAGFVFIALELF